MSPSTISRPWMDEARLEGLRVKEGMARLRLPERGQHLGVDAMCVARLRADPVANALPVVFRRRRNTISVVAKANLVGGLKLTQCVLHRGKLGIAGDTGMERR
jgi:hypothetical protein